MHACSQVVVSLAGRARSQHVASNVVLQAGCAHPLGPASLQSARCQHSKEISLLRQCRAKTDGRAEPLREGASHLEQRGSVMHRAACRLLHQRWPQQVAAAPCHTHCMLSLPVHLLLLFGLHLMPACSYQGIIGAERPLGPGQDQVPASCMPPLHAGAEGTAREMLCCLLMASVASQVNHLQLDIRSPGMRRTGC